MENKRNIQALRDKAEALLDANKDQINFDEYKNDVVKLIEELSIYQIELELQNEDLRKNQIELTKEKERFSDLFINAPFGYFLFDKNGLILKYNKKSAEILEIFTSHYDNKPFAVFLEPLESPKFHKHIKEVFESDSFTEKQIEINVRSTTGKIRTLRLKSNLFQGEYCRTLAEDITDENMRIAEIAELSSRLETAMVAGNMAWWQLELPSGKVTFSENKTKMLGYNMSDFTHYKDFMQYVHPEDYDIAMNAMRDHIEGKKAKYDIIYRIKHKDGHYLYFRDAGAIVKNKSGNIILSGLVIDVTKRIEYEKKIENKEEETRKILNSFPGDVYMKDPDFNLIYMNDNLAKRVGADKIGKKCYEALFGLNEQCKWCKSANLQAKREQVSYEFYDKNKDKYFQVFGNILENKNELYIFLDNTELKKSELEIKRSEEKFRKIFYNTKVIKMLIRARDAQILSVNQAAIDFYGYSEEEFLKKKIYDLNVLPVEQVNKEMKSSIEGEKSYFIFQHKIANGEIKDIEVYSTPIDTPDGIQLYSLVHDITERMKLEREIKQKNEELEELNKTKDKFFNIIAHDLKNPFNTILAFSEMISDEKHAKEEEFVKKLANNINSASWRAFKLLENLLEWSRAQTGRINFEPTQVKLDDILIETIGLLNSAAKQKEIQIEKIVPKNLEVFADRNMLTTIIRNLINNAIKYTKRGGVILIKATDYENEVQIFVKDNGIGMNSQTLSKLFRIDKRNSVLGTEKENGTGIGLLLCKEFVEKHKGKIWAESELDKGSKFIFTIPKM